MFVVNPSLKLFSLIWIIFLALKRVSGLNLETLIDVKERQRGLNLKTSAFNVS